MNKLEYCIALREKGLDSIEIKKKLIVEGIEESQIQYYLKKSDELFLNQLMKSNLYKSRSKGKAKNTIKIIVLIISLILLCIVFLGYAYMGLIGLFFIWILIRYSSFR